MTEPVSGNWQKGQVSKSENSREETEIVRLIVYLFMRRERERKREIAKV